MFSSQGTTPLVRLQTRVNAQIYKNIVKDHVVPIIQNSGFDRATFMQNNAPCHKAKVVMSYLSEQDFEIMDWPPQSPDLNPLENLWKTLGVKVMERNPLTGRICGWSFKKNGLKLVSRIVKNWFVLVVEDVQLSLRARAHLLNIDLHVFLFVFCLFTLFFSMLSLTFGRSKFESKKIIVIILFLSFASASNFSMLLWMITTTSCQNFSFSQLLFLTNIRF